MRAQPTQPMTKSSLARQLEVPVEQRAELRKAIEALVADGLIHEGKKACYLLRAKTGNTLTGSLKFHPKGHAFFFPDATDESNLATGLDLVALNRIHIPRRDAGTALDGDRVLISLQKPSPKRPFRTRSEIIPDTPDEPRGKVEKILSRRSGRLVGIFRNEKGFSWIDCEDKAVDGRVELSGDTTAQPGQMVVVDLENWNDPKTTPRGRIIEVLGWPGDPGVDMIAVIHRFGLRTSFPDEVLAAARAVPEEPEPAEIARRIDWRDKLVITIDPAEFGASREEVRLALEAENIESRPVWKPLHLQPVFAACRVRGGAFVESIFDLGLCLPSGSNLAPEDHERVCELVLNVPKKSTPLVP